MRFENDKKAAPESLTQIVCSQIRRHPRYEVQCEPDLIQVSQLEQELCMLGSQTRDACSIRVAEHLQAAYVVTGIMGRFGRCLTINLSLLDVHNPGHQPRKVTVPIDAMREERVLVGMSWAVRELMEPATHRSELGLDEMQCKFNKIPGEAFALLALGVAAVTAGVLMDTLPDFANNRRLDAVDFVPAGLYVGAAVSLSFGIFEWFTHGQTQELQLDSIMMPDASVPSRGGIKNW